MADQAPPSVDPADLGDMAGMFRALFRKYEMQHHDMLPATVIAYDRVSNRATIKPMIQQITTTDQAVSRAGVASVPVFQFGGGGFMVSVPIKPGDRGWIKAADRDISLFMASNQESVPNTLRARDFSDSMFYPDVLFDFTIDGDDTERLTIQSLDATTKISVGDGSIKCLVSGVGFEVTSDGVNFIGGKVTHDGTVIDKTHIHSQGSDSHGDSEVDTGGPHA